MVIKIGDKFDQLTIVKNLGLSHGRKVWLCSCSCGKTCTRKQGSLLKAAKLNRSCGCLKGKEKIKDISGKKFGRLTVTKYVGRYGVAGSLWECQCDCGKIVQRPKANLGNGSNSCGCIKIEMLQSPNRTNTVKRQCKSVINSVYSVYKSGASRRGIEFNIEKEDFEKLIKEDCFYCGSPPKNVASSYYEDGLQNKLIYNGIDRVDNKIGYNITNCVPCCKICNISKRDLSKEDFLTWIKNAYNKLFNKI